MRADSDIGRVLLAGDLETAFVDAGAVRELGCEVYSNMLDAIEAAAREEFAVIGVVMAGTSSKLDSVLNALRGANSKAKIVLLAQMYEEPLAMQLVGSSSNGASVADDYLICPILTSRFCELVVGDRSMASEKTTSVSMPVLEIAKTVRAVPADTAVEEKIKRLEKLATEDELTGLRNRRYLWEFSRQIIERAKKENGRVTVLIFDIDNFKHYNDIYGHAAGDKILKQAAVLMRRSCRSHDVVGRIGGDEFAVVFWDDPRRKQSKEERERRSARAEHPKEAIFIAKRFRRELEKAELHMLGPGGEGVLTISGGLASFPRDSSTMQELFQQADMALLKAKRSGKNRIYLVGKSTSDVSDVEQ